MSASDPAEADVRPTTNDSDETTLLASAALTYAQHGVAIFPVKPNGKAPALPKCPQAKAHNLTGKALAEHAKTCDGDGHGFHDATTDTSTVARWWTERPDANIGVALGANNIFTVDVDGPEGRAALDELENTYQPLPDTYQVITGRIEGSGRHHIFHQPDDRRVPNGKLGHPKLEIKGDGGYVVAPPSIHESGRPYIADGSWSQITDPPDWLVALATRPEPALIEHQHIAGTDQLAQKRLQGLAGHLAMMAPNSGRNQALNHAAYIAGQLIGAGRLDRNHAEEQLTQAANRCGLDVDSNCGPSGIAATINSGITSGIDKPDIDTGTDATLEPLTVTTIQQPDRNDQTPPDNSWAPVDGTDYIDGTWTPPQPTQLQRDDGTCLLYPGRINLLFGESEAGKGWVALHAISQALAGGDTVLYIDFEDYPDTIYARLKLLGLDRHQLAPDRFAYIRPDHGLDDPGRQALGDTVARLDPDLVVLDGITGAMSLHQLDTNASTDVDQFYSLLGEPLARHGAAVVFIDHVTKSSENRGKGPIGSQHKRARVSGASYEISSVQPIAPGRAGKLRIKIDKDRLGAVRGTHPSQAGDFHLDSTGDTTVAKIYAPSGSPEGAAERKVRDMMVRLSSALEDAGDAGLGIRGINEVGGSAKDIIRDAIDRLVEGGWAARTPGPNRSLLHKHVARYTGDVTVLGVPHVPANRPVSPGRVPMSPSVPDASGTPLAANGRQVSPVSPDVLSRGHRDTDEPTHPNTPRQVPL